jgi:geranylgeranyl reductase family protein
MVADYAAFDNEPLTLPPEDVDVLIVGSGPAGASTAHHLVNRDAGWAGRVLLLEKAVHPRDKLCGGGITHLGQNVLARLGYDLEPRSFPVREVRLVYEDLTLSFRGNPVFSIVDRGEFDHWLVQKVESSGVAVRQGEGVTDVVAHDDHVLVTTERRQIRAKCVIAADGSLSTVRRKVEQRDGTKNRVSLARLIEVQTPLGHSDASKFTDGVALFDVTPLNGDLQGYYWEFPTYTEGKSAMSRGVFDSLVLPGRPRARLKEVLRDALSVASIDLKDHQIQGHPIRSYHRSVAVSRPRVLMVGDAAGVDPLFGEGISLALAYGDVAADAVIDAFARDDFDFSDYRRRLHRHWILWALPWRTRLARVVNYLDHPILLRAAFRSAAFVVRFTRWADADQSPIEPARLRTATNQNMSKAQHWDNQ